MVDAFVCVSTQFDPHCVRCPCNSVKNPKMAQSYTSVAFIWDLLRTTGRPEAVLRRFLKKCKNSKKFLFPGQGHGVRVNDGVVGLLPSSDYWL